MVVAAEQLTLVDALPMAAEPPAAAAPAPKKSELEKAPQVSLCKPRNGVVKPVDHHLGVLRHIKISYGYAGLKKLLPCAVPAPPRKGVSYLRFRHSIPLRAYGSPFSESPTDFPNSLAHFFLCFCQIVSNRCLLIGYVPQPCPCGASEKETGESPASFSFWKLIASSSCPYSTYWVGLRISFMLAAA